jgi:integrase
MTPSSTGSWSARAYNPLTGKQDRHSLGEFSLPENQRFDAAKRAAEAWFDHLGKGGTSAVMTVADACDAYVTHLRESKGKIAAKDADKRFDRWVKSEPKLGATPLTKLTAAQIEAWRLSVRKAPLLRKEPGQARADATVNRDMTAFRAALNLAFENGHVTSDHAWRVKLTPIKNADRRRDIYVGIDARRKLIGNAATDLALLLKGLSLIPLRPGALAGLTVRDYDRQLKTLTVGKDKTGQARKVSLPGITAAFFDEQARTKLPGAPLLARVDGRFWNKDAWKHPMKEAVSAAELQPGTTAYSIRHSVITDLIHSGLDTLTVAQLSGTSVAMIEKYYGHLTKEHARSALAMLTL